MRKQILTAAVLFTTMLCSGQSKFSLTASGGALMVKEDVGENFELTAGYAVTEKIEVRLSGMQANLKTDVSDQKYHFKKLALTASCNIIGDVSFGLYGIMGFSYVNFDRVLELDKRGGLGLDLGLQPTFGLEKNLQYGFIINSTFATVSPGGILQSNFFLRYKF